jgi:hypothetical protein
MRRMSPRLPHPRRHSHPAGRRSGRRSFLKSECRREHPARARVPRKIADFSTSKAKAADKACPERSRRECPPCTVTRQPYCVVPQRHNVSIPRSSETDPYGTFVPEDFAPRKLAGLQLSHCKGFIQTIRLPPTYTEQATAAAPKLHATLTAAYESNTRREVRVGGDNDHERSILQH